MLTTSKTRQKYWPITLSIAVTLILWLGSKWYYQDWFANPYKYIAKSASLTATVMMCWCVVLSTRLRFLEGFFNGLDKVYQVHKRIGRWAFFVIFLHPVFLSIDNLPDVFAFLGSMWLQSPAGDRYLWGQNVGVLTFLLMAGLVTVTLWVRLPYHLWKRTHEWFGFVLVLIFGHILVVDQDVAAYPVLRIWMYVMIAIAVAAFLFIRFLYRIWGPAFRYTVSRIMRNEDILEITLAPQQGKMDFKPSQFAYLVIHKEGITPEPHPYSIACGYNLDAEIRFGIKKIGDHTRSLESLERGDHATLYGPYGHFSERFLLGERDCVFVGGGIGITPFLGMWHVALHSEERLEKQEVPARLQDLHPEIIKTWKSPIVSMFYVCNTREEASFDKDIRQEVIMSHFHGFKAFQERGHHYELYLSSTRGLITAEYIDREVRGGIKDKNIFLCGPSPMIVALISQFMHLGVMRDQIIVEDFNLV